MPKATKKPTSRPRVAANVTVLPVEFQPPPTSSGGRRRHRSAANVVQIAPVRERAGHPAKLTVDGMQAWQCCANPVPRQAELLGLMPDGRMVLWSVDNVLPITAFPTRGGHIEHDHYVIAWKGQAIAVHCSNCSDGTIEVMFMGGGLRLSMPKLKLEKILLGRVGTEAQRASMSAMLSDLCRDLRERHNAAHLQRGRL